MDKLNEVLANWRRTAGTYVYIMYELLQRQGVWRGRMIVGEETRSVVLCIHGCGNVFRGSSRRKENCYRHTDSGCARYMQWTEQILEAKQCTVLIASYGNFVTPHTVQQQPTEFSKEIKAGTKLKQELQKLPLFKVKISFRSYIS